MPQSSDWYFLNKNFNVPNKIVGYQQLYIPQTFNILSKFNAQNTLYFSQSEESWKI